MQSFRARYSSKSEGVSVSGSKVQVLLITHHSVRQFQRTRIKGPNQPNVLSGLQIPSKPAPVNNRFESVYHPVVVAPFDALRKVARKRDFKRPLMVANWYHVCLLSVFNGELPLLPKELALLLDRPRARGGRQVGEGRPCLAGQSECDIMRPDWLGVAEDEHAFEQHAGGFVSRATENEMVLVWSLEQSLAMAWSN